MSNPVPLADRAPVDPFAAIDADLDLLLELDPADQVPVFGRVHAALTSALAATAGTTSAGPTSAGTTATGSSAAGNSSTAGSAASAGPARPHGGHPAGPGRPHGSARQHRGGR